MTNDDVMDTPNRGMQFYLVVWCTLALGAMGYIGFLAIGEPNRVTRAASLSAQQSLPMDSIQLTEHARATDKTIERISAQVRTIGRDLIQTQAESQQVRDDVAELHAWKTEIIATGMQLSEASPAADEAPRRVTMVVPEAQPARTQQTQIVVPVRTDPEPSGIEGVVLPGNGNAPERVTASDVGLALQPDGSLATASTNQVDTSALTATPGFTTAIVVPDVPLPDRVTYGVELARGPNIEAIRLSWDLLNERHGNLLRGLGSRYVEARTEATNPYRLIAGPFVNRAEAIGLCARLATVSLACRPTAFAGAVL